MNDLANFYVTVKNDYYKAEHYYLMAIDKGYSITDELILFYEIKKKDMLGLIKLFIKHQKSMNRTKLLEFIKMS